MLGELLDLGLLTFNLLESLLWFDNHLIKKTIYIGASKNLLWASRIQTHWPDRASGRKTLALSPASNWKTPPFLHPSSKATPLEHITISLAYAIALPTLSMSNEWSVTATDICFFWFCQSIWFIDRRWDLKRISTNNNKNACKINPLPYLLNIHDCFLFSEVTTVNQYKYILFWGHLVTYIG